MTDLFLARAEALGEYYAKKGKPRRKISYMDVLHGIQYQPVYGKGEDNYHTEIDFQAALVQVFDRAYLDTAA